MVHVRCVTGMELAMTVSTVMEPARATTTQFMGFGRVLRVTRARLATTDRRVSPNVHVTHLTGRAAKV